MAASNEHASGSLLLASPPALGGKVRVPCMHVSINFKTMLSLVTVQDWILLIGLDLFGLPSTGLAVARHKYLFVWL